MLLHTFYPPVFYATHDQHFPSDSEEHVAFWVGFAEHCGDSLTHMVLDAVTLKFIYRSAIRPMTLKNHNQRLVAAGGEEGHQPHTKTLKHPTSSSDVDKPVEKTPVLFYLDLHSPEINNSHGSFDIFPKGCLFTCIFHSL